MYTKTKKSKILVALLGLTLAVSLAVATVPALGSVSTDDRSPGSVTVNPGDSVDVQVTVTIDGGDNLTAIDDNPEDGAGDQFADFSSVDSSESGTGISGPGGAAYSYNPEVNGSSSTTVTFSYTVDVASDADPGTYDIEGNARINESDGSNSDISTGATTVTVKSDTPTATPTASSTRRFVPSRTASGSPS